MQPLPHPSVSPLPSFCHVRSDPVRRYMSFQETVQAIIRHLTGRPRPSMRERWLAEKAVERLAEEMAAETEMDEAAETINPTKIPESHGRDESHDGRTG
jgi:hypothetical protein